MRICFLTSRFPYPLLKGDTTRIYHQLRTLSRNHELTLVSLAEAPIPPEDFAQVAALCERVEVVPLARWRMAWNLGTGLASAVPLQVHYYRSAAARQRLAAVLAAGHFDVIHATLIRVLPYVWGVPHPPVVADLIDSLTLNLAGRRRQVRGPMRLGYELEYRRVRQYEQAVVRRFPALVVTAEADRQDLGGGAHISVIPNAVDLDHFVFHGAEGRAPATLIFTGNMGYHPNREAVLWFAAEVWPRLRAQCPAARWQIVGANPDERVRALAGPGSGIEVLGRVPNMTTYLGQATIAIAPMRSGSGIQTKVLEAMAVGTPVVATSLANRGVQATPDCDLRLADTPADLVAALSALLADPAAQARLGQAGRAFVEQHFRWEQHAARLTAIYTALSGK
jgi:sugar transferase (PEP-CTERM/EpsH1 system associated)